MRHVPVPGTGHDYIGRLGKELAAVGIRGGARARILAEAADHLAEGEEEQFGDRPTRVAVWTPPAVPLCKQQFRRRWCRCTEQAEGAGR